MPVGIGGSGDKSELTRASCIPVLVVWWRPVGGVWWSGEWGLVEWGSGDRTSPRYHDTAYFVAKKKCKCVA